MGTQVTAAVERQQQLCRRLSVRIQDAGWLWSGGFSPDTPGDIFVNIRHRSDTLARAIRSGLDLQMVSRMMQHVFCVRALRNCLIP